MIYRAVRGKRNGNEIPLRELDGKGIWMEKQSALAFGSFTWTAEKTQVYVCETTEM